MHILAVRAKFAFGVTVGVPSFQTSKFASLSAKIDRDMGALHHMRHRDRLVFRADALAHGLLIISEAYSTGMCLNCQHFTKQGASKTFRCPKCLHTAQRDGGASGKILMFCLRTGEVFADSIKGLAEKK